MSTQARSAVSWGARRVGDGQPVVVIAEAGVNHNGSVTQALRLVDAAADAGADVVKFQMFRAAELVTATAELAEYQRASGAGSQHAMLAALELSENEFQRIAQHCTDRQIEFLATPFSAADVDRLLRLGVQALKIASTDLNNPLLLRRAASTRLPLLLSTGAATPGEIAVAIRRLRQWDVAQRTLLLHCISGYPAPLEAANLRAIATLRQVSGRPCGFSDHTESTEIAGWAVAVGACVLEKHFTLDRNAAGPDHAMSLTPAQLAEYVAAARRTAQALGSGTLGMSSIEANVRAVARKSVVAAAPIPAGVTISAAMLTVKRPGGGIPPDELDAVVGRQARAAIAADTVLTWDALQ
jgi:N,N'-diacetyllegionaminate synthase